MQKKPNRSSKGSSPVTRVSKRTLAPSDLAISKANTLGAVRALRKGGHAALQKLLDRLYPGTVASPSPVEIPPESPVLNEVDLGNGYKRVHFKQGGSVKVKKQEIPPPAEI